MVPNTCLFHVRLTARQEKEKGKERNDLYNGELDTFYLRLYGVGHFVEYQ